MSQMHAGGSDQVLAGLTGAHQRMLDARAHLVCLEEGGHDPQTPRETLAAPAVGDVHRELKMAEGEREQMERLMLPPVHTGLLSRLALR